MNKKSFALGVFISFWLGVAAILCLSQYILSDKFVAIIRVTDAYGNPVDVLPKSVVCLAERSGETLICRVDSVR